MKQIIGENEALLFCELRADGFYMLRCQTSDAILKLPREIEGVPLVGLSDYVCAVREPDLSHKAVEAFHLTCGSAKLPVHNAQAIRQVILPDTVRSIGSYAFYNCYHLKHLEMAADVQEIGHGALMNCSEFSELVLHGNAEGHTCLQEMLGQTSGEVQVQLSFAAGEVRLLFPPYQEQWEDLAPAHIFQRRIEGAGYPYRQCFQNGILSLSQYDMAFERLLRIQDYETAVRVALSRLRWCVGVSAMAHKLYVDCLRTHADVAARMLIDARDTQGIHALLHLGVLSGESLHKACDHARQTRQTESLGILLAALSGGSSTPTVQKQYDL